MSGQMMDPAAPKPWGPFPWDDARVATDELMKWLRSNRHTKPPEVLNQVFQLWFQYAQSMLPPGGAIPPQMSKYVPNLGAGMAAQGPPNPAGVGVNAGTGGPKPPGETAEQELQGRQSQADSTAEKAARPGRPHEG